LRPDSGLETAPDTTTKAIPFDDQDDFQSSFLKYDVNALADTLQQVVISASFQYVENDATRYCYETEMRA
jgi:hypothetical protein